MFGYALVPVFFCEYRFTRGDGLGEPSAGEREREREREREIERKTVRHQMFLQVSHSMY